MSREFDDDFEDIEVNKSAARSLELDTIPGDEEFSSEATRRIEKADRRRRKNKKKKKKNHTALWLILLMLLAIGGVVGAKYYMNMNGMSFDDLRNMIPFLKQEAPVETSAAEETVPVETTAEETEAEITLAENTNAEVLDLVKSYYAARLAGDADGLSKILADGIEIDTEALNSEKEFVESYDDVTTYVTDGMEDDEYAVYVSYNQKFKDIETAAPGLAPCYVSTAVDGTMRLSFFSDWDENTKNFMNQISGSKAVTELAKKVGDDFTAAKNADESLKNFLAALSGESTAAEETTAAESEAAETESAATAAETTASSGEVTFKEVDDIQYTTTQVRCRKAPSLEETDDYTMLEAGAWVHVIGTSEKWSKVITGDGYSGYVYNEYLTPDKPETEEE